MSNIVESFELSDGEKMHPLWTRLKAHLETQLQSIRARNDSAKLTEADTAALRGQISALKALIALGEDRPDTTGIKRHP